MKIPRIRKKKHTSDSKEASSRITNETVAEHREKILAGGRRFKYPVQYARHKLVFNAIIIAVVTFIVAVIVIWWQLYLAQNTTTFFYRITRVLPLPVAVVDGQQVRFSDYLVGFRSQEHYLQNKEGVNLYANENQKQLEYIKRQALNDAIADAYAAMLAKQKGISIADGQIDEAIERQRRSSDGLTSKDTYDAIVLDQFNWTPEEAREVTAARLLRQEVAFQVDDTASKQLKLVRAALKNEDDFGKIASSVPAFDGVKVETGVTPLVPSSNQDGGLAEAASKMKAGTVSSVIRSTTGDGYYFVRLIDKSEDGRISYEFIKISLTKFDKKLQSILKSDKVHEFIDVPKLDN